MFLQAKRKLDNKIKILGYILSQENLTGMFLVSAHHVVQKPIEALSWSWLARQRAVAKHVIWYAQLCTRVLVILCTVQTEAGYN